jgi:peptide/nickel transport system substrate-binding protein
MRRRVLERVGRFVCLGRRPWALGLSVAMTSLAGCGPPQPAADSQIITIALRTGPNNLDPRLANDESTAHVAQLIFSSLMDWSDDLRAIPKLAHRLDNPDPLTYVAHLRRGVTFHDGHELTSRDVVYTYRSMIDPAFVSPYKSAFRSLASVKALDDYTVEFTLNQPFAAFPTQLITPPIVPDGAGTSMSVSPVGTGPYRFVKYAVDDRVELSAFGGYYGGRPSNTGLVLKVIPDDTMRGLELRKGAVDLTINDMPPDIVHQLERSGEFRVDRSPGLDFFYVGFNLQDPVLSDRRVRHAIGYAIDRQAIVDYLRRGLARPAVGLLTSLAWAFEPDVFQFTHDPARAKRLLDEAGYPDPDGDGPRPRLRLTMKISTSEETRLQCMVIQQDLKRVGIDLELRSHEFATMFADVLSGNFQVTALQWVGGAVGDPDILRRVYHSSQMPPAGFNRGRYNNPEADRLIDLATKALTADERRQSYSALQKVVAEDAVYIPIWSKVNAVVRRPTLTGMQVNPMADFQALASLKRVAR